MAEEERVGRQLDAPARVRGRAGGEGRHGGGIGRRRRGLRIIGALPARRLQGAGVPYARRVRVERAVRRHGAVRVAVERGSLGHGVHEHGHRLGGVARGQRAGAGERGQATVLAEEARHRGVLVLGVERALRKRRHETRAGRDPLVVPEGAGGVLLLAHDADGLGGAAGARDAVGQLLSHAAAASLGRDAQVARIVRPQHGPHGRRQGRVVQLGQLLAPHGGGQRLHERERVGSGQVAHGAAVREQRRGVALEGAAEAARLLVGPAGERNLVERRLLPIDGELGIRHGRALAAIGRGGRSAVPERAGRHVDAADGRRGLERRGGKRQAEIHGVAARQGIALGGRHVLPANTGRALGPSARRHERGVRHRQPEGRKALSHVRLHLRLDAHRQLQPLQHAGQAAAHLPFAVVGTTGRAGQAFGVPRLSPRRLYQVGVPASAASVARSPNTSSIRVNRLSAASRAQTVRRSTAASSSSCAR